MIRSIKETGRWNEVLFLAILSLLCFFLSVFRFIYSDTKVFLFLNWNLFLAFVPWCMGIALQLKPARQWHKLTAVAWVLAWLAFFPNAPYILTDLFHLKERSGIPVWFDLVLILLYAWTGLLFGFFSLFDIQATAERFLPGKQVKYLSIVLLFLAGFGIYLGRYLRWNTWDIVTRPWALFQDIISRFTDPMHHPRTWGMTLFMGLLLNVLFYSFRMIRARQL